MRVISVSKDSGTKERKKEVTGLVKADRLDKEKFLNEVLKLQSDLLQITDYKSLLTQIEGLLQCSPLFDKVEVISSVIGKEKPITLRANDHVFSVENENVVSKFKVRAINLTQFQECLPYFICFNLSES